jgi:hypothetical protein
MKKKEVPQKKRCHILFGKKRGATEKKKRGATYFLGTSY